MVVHPGFFVQLYGVINFCGEVDIGGGDVGVALLGGVIVVGEGEFDDADADRASIELGVGMGADVGAVYAGEVDGLGSGGIICVEGFDGGGGRPLVVQLKVYELLDIVEAECFLSVLCRGEIAGLAVGREAEAYVDSGGAVLDAVAELGVCGLVDIDKRAGP